MKQVGKWASVKAGVNATSLKSNFVGNFVRARN
jgi:hypothetical protein